MGIHLPSSRSFIRLENILIIGNGGRENSLAWAIQKNELVKKVYLIPGNAGSERINKCERIKIDINNKNELVEKLDFLKIDLVVIGPEIHLANGLADFLRKKDFKVFGPNKDGAKLEFSKSWAKEFMQDANIPTANFWKVNSLEEAKKIINSTSIPLVVKADGLASGKGVFIPNSKDECFRAAESIFNGRFGNSGNVVVLEEKIQGPEVSVFALCDGKRYTLLPTAQDHKRLNEKDKGPNTGGMGAYSPTPISSSDLIDKVKLEIIEPTLEAMVDRGHPYRGFLYIGLMIVKGVPYVIEFNVRLGDPEAQVILPIMQSSFFDLVWATVNGKLDKVEISNSSKTAVAVVLASKGYPGSYNKGMRIKGLQNVTDDIVFHAGTSRIGHDIIVNGGRVLNIVAFGEDLIKAVDNAYNIVKKIEFEGKYYRTDIGYRGINMLKKGA